jgi:hypothetical protein
MIDWQTSPLAKCRLFSIQDQLCSFADLKQMHSGCRLFRQGGDIQTPIAVKKAVRWNFETLPFYYCDALKNILDIGVFSKEKHIPEIFRMKPDLSDANNRIDLLKKLKAEADTDKYYNAVRYLLHGQKDQYEYYGDIEIPDIPTGDKELFSIGIKLLGELNREKPDFNIPSELIAVFSEIEMESFGIKKLRFSEKVRAKYSLMAAAAESVAEKIPKISKTPYTMPKIGLWRVASSIIGIANSRTSGSVAIAKTITSVSAVKSSMPTSTPRQIVLRCTRPFIEAPKGTKTGSMQKSAKAA